MQRRSGTARADPSPTEHFTESAYRKRHHRLGGHLKDVVSDVGGGHCCDVRGGHGDVDNHRYNKGEEMPYIDPSSVVDYDTIRNLSELQIRELYGMSSALELSPASVGMLRFAAIGASDYTGPWPADTAEMRLCWQAYDIAPRWLRDNMNALIESFQHATARSAAQLVAS